MRKSVVFLLSALWIAALVPAAQAKHRPKNESAAITKLFKAAELGNQDDVSRIIQESHLSPDVRDRHGNTPLMIAAEKDRGVTVKTLLKLGADKTLKNTRGMTALELARSHHHADIIPDLETDQK